MVCVEYSQGFTYVSKRPNNEDYIEPVSCTSSDRIYVVCDGMGGHGHGEIASKIVAHGFYERLHLTPVELINEDYLQRVLQQVQADLNEAEIVDEERKMGTTIVVVVIKDDSVLVGHIGDSRLYHFRDGKCIFRTYDHSVVEEGVQAHLLTEEQARSHPKKGQLTQCVQPHPQQSAFLTIDTLYDLQTDDVLLCVTDGVVDVITTSELGLLSAEVQDESFIMKLCAQCEMKGNDNYSGFYLRLSCVHPAPKKPELPPKKEKNIEETVQERSFVTNVMTEVMRVLHRPYVIAMLFILLSFIFGICVGRSCSSKSKTAVGKRQAAAEVKHTPIEEEKTNNTNTNTEQQ